MLKRVKKQGIWVVVSIAAVVMLLLAGARATSMLVSAPMRGVVCIDAGHGGFDPGAVGHSTDIGEDVINLAIAQELKAEFEARGYAVVMTREDENALAGTKAEDMQKRRDIIGKSDAILMISIHMNANGDTSVNGPIVYYYPGSDEGQRLAQSIQDQLNQQLRPPVDKKINSDNYFVLRAGGMPSVIVEVGFMSNSNDEYRLQQADYQQKAAAAIAEGAENFLRAQAENELRNP